MLRLWDPVEFFVQQVHGGVVSIDGDRATVRWSVQETARRRDGGPYNNHAFYEDELANATGWRFVRRTYRDVWLDLKSPIGGDAVQWLIAAHLSSSRAAISLFVSSLSSA